MAARTAAALGRGLSLAFLLTASCAEEQARAPAVESGVAPASPRSVGEYPEGPYATLNPEVGDVLPNLQLLGFAGVAGSKTRVTKELQATSFEDLQNSGKRYALLHTSAVWCASCLVEAYYLGEATQDIAEAGGTTLELVVDGVATGADPTYEELEVWIETADLRVTTMGPADEELRKVFRDRDIVYIVDLQTMTVVWKLVGPLKDPTTAERGAQELLLRLAQ